VSALSSCGAGDTSFKVNGTPRGLPQRGRAPRTRSLSKAPANPRSRSRKEPGDMATMIWQSVVHAVFRRREHMATQAAKFDVTLPQAQLLRLLEHAPARNMGALADALSCDASNITGLVDRLEARGLITRGLAKNDRRVKTILITRRGSKLVAELTKLMFEPPDELRKLSSVQLSALNDLVELALTPAPAHPRSSHVVRSNPTEAP
jgi:DNA-binding MarR family transcriptional regulator